MCHFPLAKLVIPTRSFGGGRNGHTEKLPLKCSLPQAHYSNREVKQTVTIISHEFSFCLISQSKHLNSELFYQSLPMINTCNTYYRCVRKTFFILFFVRYTPKYVGLTSKAIRHLGGRPPSASRQMQAAVHLHKSY